MVTILVPWCSLLGVNCVCADKVTSFVIIVSLDMLSLCFRQNKSVIILKSDIHLNIRSGYYI